jgi:hypothetical protein
MRSTPLMAAALSFAINATAVAQPTDPAAPSDQAGPVGLAADIGHAYRQGGKAVLKMSEVVAKHLTVGMPIAEVEALLRAQTFFVHMYNDQLLIAVWNVGAPGETHVIVGFKDGRLSGVSAQVMRPR